MPLGRIFSGRKEKSPASPAAQPAVEEDSRFVSRKSWSMAGNRKKPVNVEAKAPTYSLDEIYNFGRPRAEGNNRDSIDSTRSQRTSINFSTFGRISSSSADARVSS